MNSPYNLGIIGFGFLGTAICHGFSLHANIKIYDKYKDGFDTLEDTVKSSEFIFFCLPTPMFDDDGSQDLSILDGAVKAVHDEVLKLRAIGDQSRKIALIKSTVLPGTNRMFQAKYPELIFVSSPEFLTARSNRLDFICASRHIFGGQDQVALNRVVELFRHRFGNSVPIYTTDFETAELVKYTANCFFAVKVSYFNFIYDLCGKLGVKYDDVKDMVLADGRIGRSHCDVGGGSGVSDNKRQFGGHCFPKDINALINFSKQLGLDPELLKASWSQNVKGRPERDWEQLSGVVSKRPTIEGNIINMIDGTPTHTQERPDLCEECGKVGFKSTVYEIGGMSTCAGSIPFYDEQGKYHNHDSNTITNGYRCSNGHCWYISSRGSCWCGWGTNR